MPVLKVRDPNTGAYVPLLGSGTSDHGALTGLLDDDHPQYVKDIGDAMSGPLSINYDVELVPTANLTLATNTGPAITFDKKAGSAGNRIWRQYVSGAAGESGSSAAALSFAPRDDANLNNLKVFRMQRDGRLTLGADPTGSLDAATKQYVDVATTPEITSLSVHTDWNDYGGGGRTTIVKVNRMVTIHFMLSPKTNKAVTKTSYSLGIIPVGFRPYYAGSTGSMCFESAGPTLGTFRILADSVGGFSAQFHAAGTIQSATGWLLGSMTYYQET